jgi:hypothetical protein
VAEATSRIFSSLAGSAASGLSLRVVKRLIVF